jgi:hypothetical protein
MLTTEITAISLSDSSSYENEFIEFSCFDGDTEMTISFMDKMNEAHACFLVEHTKLDKTSAYGQMVFKLGSMGIESLTVGETFRSE